MNIDLKTQKLTWLLIFICTSIYLIQVLTGFDLGDSEDLLHWGANWVFYSFTNQPWRMLTSIFLHVGFIHLFVNMLMLYFFGKATEKTLGSCFYLALFIISGIAGNILSNCYMTLMIAEHGLQPSPINVGASGGIMGVGTALLMLSLFKITKLSKPQLKVFTIVMGISLILGFIIPGVDNEAHIGGALTGAAMALIFTWFYKKSTKETLRAYGKVIATISIALIWSAIYYMIQSNNKHMLLDILERIG